MGVNQWKNGVESVINALVTIMTSNHDENILYLDGSLGDRSTTTLRRSEKPKSPVSLRCSVRSLGSGRAGSTRAGRGREDEEEDEWRLLWVLMRSNQPEPSPGGSLHKTLTAAVVGLAVAADGLELSAGTRPAAAAMAAAVAASSGAKCGRGLL